MITIYQTRREMYDAVFTKNGVGAELGVCFGYNVVPLLQASQPTKLYLCDVWEVEDGSRESAAQISAEHPETVLVRERDEQWIPTLADRSLDWAYIDTLHNYEQTKLEMRLLRTKIKSGGIIAGHDMICLAEHVCVFANLWDGGVLQAVLEILSEGWLEVIALTRACNLDGPDNLYPSWACRVTE